MKRNNTLHLCYVICVVIVLLVYPLKNYSARVSVTEHATIIQALQTAIAAEENDVLHSELLFKY